MADEAQTDPLEAVRVRSNELQGIVDDAFEGNLSAEEVTERLRAAKATPGEINGVFEQIQQRLDEDFEEIDPPLNPAEPARETTTDNRTAGGDTERDRAVNEEQERAAEEAFWASVVLRASSLRGKDTRPKKVDHDLETSLGAILGSLAPASSTTVSDSLLKSVPGLSNLSASSGSAHLDKTFQRRKEFAAEKSLDPLVDLLQRKQLDEPIP